MARGLPPPRLISVRPSAGSPVNGPPAGQRAPANNPALRPTSPSFPRSKRPPASPRVKPAPARPPVGSPPRRPGRWPCPAAAAPPSRGRAPRAAARSRGASAARPRPRSGCRPPRPRRSCLAWHEDLGAEWFLGGWLGVGGGVGGLASWLSNAGGCWAAQSVVGDESRRVSGAAAADAARPLSQSSRAGPRTEARRAVQQSRLGDEALHVAGLPRHPHRHLGGSG
jgi:hypothetical protein